MNVQKIKLSFLYAVMLVSLTVGLVACSETKNDSWPNYPLDLYCEFIWNPPQGEGEVGIGLTVTNNQEKAITQFTVYLFSQTSYDYSNSKPPINSKQITIYDLDLAKGESYTTIVSFSMIFDGRGVAQSVSGNLYGTWVEFENGQSQWGDRDLSTRKEIYANGLKLEMKNSNNPDISKG